MGLSILAVEPDADPLLVGRGSARSGAGDFKRELSSIMLDVLRGWNQGQPMLYVLDDAHWIDAASADLLAQMFKLVEDAPIVFLCAFRPETQSPFWGIHETVIQGRFAGRSTDIVLRPLSTVDAGNMVRSLVVETGDASRLHNLILARSEGNPLFVEEIVRSLIDRGLLLPSPAKAESRWMPAPGAELSTVAIPASIQALLMQRIDRLATSG